MLLIKPCDSGANAMNSAGVKSAMRLSEHAGPVSQRDAVAAVLHDGSVKTLPRRYSRCSCHTAHSPAVTAKRTGILPRCSLRTILAIARFRVNVLPADGTATTTHLTSSFGLIACGASAEHFVRRSTSPRAAALPGHRDYGLRSAAAGQNSLAASENSVGDAAATTDRDNRGHPASRSALRSRCSRGRGRRN